jgi:hypothetical protein
MHLEAGINQEVFFAVYDSKNPLHAEFMRGVHQNNIYDTIKK